MKFLDCCTNTVQVCCKEDKLFELDVDKGYPHRNVFSRWVDLVYDSITSLGLSLWSPIEFIQSFIKII